MFCLKFDLTEEMAEKLQCRQNLNESILMFKVNVRLSVIHFQGNLHGTSLFSDDLHYILKGSKLFKNVQEDVNTMREHLKRVLNATDDFKYKSSGPAFQFTKNENFVSKIRNLPKSFGVEIRQTQF